MDKYKDYQESGIDWIGKLPTHWSLKRLKQLTTKIGSGVTPLGGSESYQESGVPLFRSQNVYSDGLRLNDVAFISPEVHESMKNSQVESGDVLLNITGASIGRCYFYEGESKKANVNQHVCIIRPNEQISPHYLQLLLASDLGQYQIDMSQNGASREGLTFGQLKDFLIPVPPIADQESIISYLDHKTTQLDTLLAQKQMLLRLLHQKRQALINEAVTQGLDPAASRKPSGVSWLGDVPAHWAVKALKYLLAEPMMYGANEAAELDDRSLPRYIRITDFGQDGKLRDETFKSLPYEVAKDYLLRSGDILFARSGATVGKTFFFSGYEGQACFAGYLIKGTFDAEKVLPEFVYLYTKSGLYENWKNSIFIQSTIQNISAEKYKALLLAVPPIKEQQEIIDWLEQRNKPINEATAAIHTQIQKLKAYRQSLISEVVTGKVDVRTEAQALAGVAPTPSPTRQASQPAPARPAAVGQLGLF